MMLGQSKNDQVAEAAVIKQFNELLAKRSKEFSASHRGAKSVVVDTQAPFNTAIANPTKYGSKDATCYNEDGKSCLWFNNYHPGVVSSHFDEIMRTPFDTNRQSINWSQKR